MANRSLRYGKIRYRKVGYRILGSVSAGGGSYLVSKSLLFATGVAGGSLLLAIGGDIAEAVIGDYADNLLLGLLFCVLTAVLSYRDPWLPLTVVGSLAGCWLLIDGVQHLRYNETRTELSVPYSHEGGPITGLLRVFLERFLEPFRLGE